MTKLSKTQRKEKDKKYGYAFNEVREKYGERIFYKSMYKFANYLNK